MEEKIFEIINTVLENRGKKRISRLHRDLNLRNDIGFDSLDLAELTVRIESIFDIDIFENGLVEDVNDILNKITNEK